MRLALLFLAACAQVAAPALAGDKDGSGATIRLEVLDGGMTARGTYLAALRMQLAEGWKTYWRAPGEAGIPPSFDWSGSSNVGRVDITWPTPQVFDLQGLRAIGYKHELVLPVEVTPTRKGQPVRLRGSVDLGVCKDVCMPATLDFDHRLDPRAGRNPVIAAALAQRPYSAKEAGVRKATCRIRPSANGVRVEARIAMPAVGGQEIAVIEPGDPQLWASETETRRKGDMLVASAEVADAQGAAAFALDRSRIRITVIGRDHAVDIRGCSAG